MPVTVGFQTVDGGELPNSPEWKHTIALEYQQGLVNLPFDRYANVLYVWQDEISFGLSQAPFLQEDSYSIANLRFGIVDKEDHYEVTAFVNNVFDESYSSELIDFGVLFSNTTALVNITPRNAELRTSSWHWLFFHMFASIIYFSGQQVSPLRCFTAATLNPPV